MAVYYHGGKGGMRKGQMVLPPTVTGAASLAGFGAAGMCKRDKVYVTTSQNAALVFAALHPSAAGMVYEVEPFGPLVDDPDCNLDGLSFECERARILRAHKLPRSVRNDILKAVIRAQPAPAAP